MPLDDHMCDACGYIIRQGSVVLSCEFCSLPNPTNTLEYPHPARVTAINYARPILPDGIADLISSFLNDGFDMCDKCIIKNCDNKLKLQCKQRFGQDCFVQDDLFEKS